MKRIYKTGKEHHLYKHGLRGTKEYITWKRIKGVVFNPRNRTYEYYGGRGIGMVKEWVNDPMEFCNYIKALPNYGLLGLTLDRINNEGNYEPGNLRWTTFVIQRHNQRMSKLNKSGYAGVHSLNRNYKPWNATINVNKKKVHIGNYNTAKEAAIARNNFIIQNNLKEYKLNEINI